LQGGRKKRAAGQQSQCDQPDIIDEEFHKLPLGGVENR
jgi:hypothetical protein